MVLTGQTQCFADVLGQLELSAFGPGILIPSDKLKPTFQMNLPSATLPEHVYP